MTPEQIRQLAVACQFPTGPVDFALVARVLNACADVVQESSRDHFVGAKPEHGICRFCIAHAKLSGISA